MSDRRVEVRPTRWSPRGEAVAEHPQRKPLMVWGGIPGEPATVRLIHEGQNVVFGAFEETSRPDKHRVEPPCDKWSPCGGCPIMHLDGDGQADARHALVRDALAEHGQSDVTIGAYHDSPDGLADFRHVVKLGFGVSRHGKPKVGAWGRRQREIVPIPKCVVAAPALNRAMTSLAHWFLELGVEPYDESTGRGLLRAAVLRCSRTTGEVLVTLVATRRSPILAELAEAIAQGATEIVGVWLHLNREPGNAIFARDEGGSVGVIALVGKDTIEERVDDITYRVGPGDFFQTNPAVAQVLYRRTLDRLALQADSAFLDLYCGVGGLALPAARATGWALGVEEVEGATIRARAAARLNGVPAEFVAGRVEEVLPGLVKRLNGARPTIAVNPARRGLEPGVAEAIAALSPQRVAYISCNPAALARDLVTLRALGFTVGPLELFNMFPNTPHVEILAVLDGPASPEGEAVSRAPRRRVARPAGA